ncbi:MAG: rhamnogalacturonan acetylesterase [Acidobacteriaceae bacterium]|nr:rhamnogalacturonan acetylesterase [Acidobacteriaceae bacterium]
MKRFCSLFALVMICIGSGSAYAAGGVRYLLVGDSTVALKSGWGPGFCADVVAGVTCIDMAKGGRSSKSYRADGSWAQVMARLKDNAKFAQTYVLIQFGHNDQPGKGERSTDVATEFPANMKAYVEEVKATGAKPILVTPLSRRSFDASGHIRDGLGPWADADIAVGRETSVPVLDLHADSIALLNKIGKAEADTLAMAPPPDPNAPVATTSTERNGDAAAKFDGTHLGAKGAAIFAHVVETELIATVPETVGSFKTSAK